MRFLLDENAEYRIARWLRADGHDVTAVAIDYGGGLNDANVLRIAVDERRIIVTNDTDFGELVFARRLPHAGVILFRLGPVDASEKWTRLEEALKTVGADFVDFLVIDIKGLRLRRSAPNAD